MKIRSKEDLFDAMQKERAWRRKELTNIKSLIYSSRASHNQVLVRAGVLMLYSHWEGYIKKACEAFFYYMNFKSIKYQDLNPNYLAIGIADSFNGNFPQKKFSSYMRTVDFVVSEAESLKFKIDVETRVDTKSNLTTDVLKDLLDMIGVDSSHFTNNQHHIDARLLKLRNAIAHGEKTENNPNYKVNSEIFYDLYDRINSLIDHFEVILTNHIELEAYKAPKCKR